MVRISLRFILILSWMKVSAGLLCPTCTYLTTDENIPFVNSSVVDTILMAAQTPECAQKLKETIPEITEEACEDISGHVQICIYYNGSLTLTSSLPVPVNVSLQLHQRGCHSVVKLPPDGCNDQKGHNEDKTTIKGFLEKVIQTPVSYTVSEFKGIRCLCSKSYCSRIPTTSMISKTLTTFSTATTSTATTPTTISTGSKTVAAELTTTSSSFGGTNCCSALIFLSMLFPACLSYTF